MADDDDPRIIEGDRRHCHGCKDEIFWGHEHVCPILTKLNNEIMFLKKALHAHHWYGDCQCVMLNVLQPETVVECQHDWKDARNKIVVSGEFCPKCLSIRAGNVTTDVPAPCPDGLLPDGETCPKCGGHRAPSGVGGGTWVHFEKEHETMMTMLIEGIEHIAAAYNDDTGHGFTLCEEKIGPQDTGPRMDVLITCQKCLDIQIQNKAAK